MTAVLRLVGVHRSHGNGEATVHALRGVDLEVMPGELVAIVGPSGSGKSTLLNIAGTLDVPTRGVVEISGQPVGELAPPELARLRRRKIGVVFQSYNLLPSLTAAENVSLPLELDGRRPAAARAEAVTALERLDLGPLADRFPTQLSGGQQQRVAIARALIGSRNLLLADEPTGALDSVNGDEVMDILAERCAEGAAGLLVTHNPVYASRAHRVIRLRDGRIDSDESAPAPAAAP